MPTSPPRPRFGGDRSEVHESLGRGAFGEVFRAFDPRLQRWVALKLRHADEPDLGSARLFLEEARRLARVRHANVVVIHGADIHDGRVGLWTDLVEGTTLDQGAVPVPLDRVVRLADELGGALEAIHEAGLIHGDVKPSNVLVEDGAARLIDFGAGRELETDSPQMFGTPGYAAPEVLAGGPATPAADQFALAVLLRRLLEGADVPRALEGVLDRAMSEAPDARYPTATAFANAVCAAGVPPRNVPAFGSAFIGRATALAELDAAARAHRLVVVVGPGGVGKTRLVARWAETAPAPDGVIWIDLAAGTDSGVVPAVRYGLDVRVQEDETDLDAVRRALDGSRAILVLDNAEHVLDAVRPLVTDLLAAASHVQLVVTSRELLRVAGEAVVDLPPLSAGADGEALELFTERARATASPDKWDAATRAQAADVCDRLDGLPLALELAAARLRGLGVHDLASRLDESLLRDPSRESRHASVDAVVQWSIALLSDDERAVLARLSAFAGEWSLDLAEDTCIDDDLSATAFTDAHAGLVEKSLVSVRDDGDRAYRLLFMVRGAAAALLDDATEHGHPRATARRDRDPLRRQSRQPPQRRSRHRPRHLRRAAREPHRRSRVVRPNARGGRGGRRPRQRRHPLLGTTRRLVRGPAHGPGRDRR